MRLFYNILFPIFFLLSAPFYFLKMWRRGGWRRGFGQRFGFYSPELSARLAGERRVIWLHAVSVGEVNLCVPLLEELSERLSDVCWVVSTTTSTGMGELCRKLPHEVVKIYYPVDLAGCVRRAWATIRPTAIVLVEAEIWPNFLWRASDEGVSVALVNARMSDRSFRGYQRFQFFFRELFESLNEVAAQSEADRKRWIDVGCRPEKVSVTGNMKFDIAAKSVVPELDVRALMAAGGVQIEGLVILGGSTHAGEEAVLGEIYLRLLKDFPKLTLILVPRHMERAASVEREMKQLKIDCVKRTDLSKPVAGHSAPSRCVIVDSTGELNDFYRVADVVFVGKSLTGQGGQNLIEPAALGKPTLVGPNMQNFRDTTAMLKEGGGLVIVQNGEELEQNLRVLLGDETLRQEIGKRALMVVGHNRGSLRSNVATCLNTFDGV